MEYNIKIGLTPEDIKQITEGEINLFHFIPTDETEYNEKINLSIKQVDENTPLSECMNLSVDNTQEQV